MKGMKVANVMNKESDENIYESVTNEAKCFIKFQVIKTALTGENPTLNWCGSSNIKHVIILLLFMFTFILNQQLLAIIFYHYKETFWSLWTNKFMPPEIPEGEKKLSVRELNRNKIQKFGNFRSS